MIAPNDWEIKKCLVLSGSLLLAILGLIGLAALGFDIPVLRQVVGFLFLTFVPGILILRILRVHNVHLIESLLYSVGLSLVFTIVVGVVANFALPPLGISRPVAMLPLLLILIPVFLLLCLLAYIRDKGFRLPSQSSNQTTESTWENFRANPAPYLLAAFLPLLAILGTLIINAYYSNILIYILIFTIVLIIGLVAFNKFIPARVYPFMIFMMALALLYQTTLISSYLVGSDIHQERYWAWAVLQNGYWNATAPSNINSCLSIVMLAPVYSLFLSMDIVWLFKIVYPLLFSLMPLALFRVFSLQIKPRYAFLAVVFFIALPIFTMDMTQLVRQQISELFFVLVILLVVDRKLTVIKRTILVVIFGCGVVMSYYGLGTGYAIGFLAVGALVLIFMKSRPGRATWQWLIGKSNALPDDLAAPGAFNKRALAIVVCLGLVFMLGYYGTVASGAPLGGSKVFAKIFRTTVTQTAEGFTMPPPETLPPEMTQGKVELPGFVESLIIRFPMLNPLKKEPLVQTALGLDFLVASPGGKVWRIFQYLVELCIVIGFIRLVFRPATLGKFKAEYLSLTIVSILILLGIFVLPTVGWGMGAVRIWGITLLLTAPLFIFGGEAIANGIAKLTRAFRRGFASFRSGYDNPLPFRLFVLLIMVPYFIFNSGLIFELSKSRNIHFIDMPYSIALSSHRLDMNSVFTVQDVTAATWLSNTARDDTPTYTDIHGRLAFPDRWGDEKAFAERSEFLPRRPAFPATTSKMIFPCRIYFRTWNIDNRMLTYPTAYGARQSISFDEISGLPQLVESGGIIYNNGGARVLFYQENKE